MFLVNTNCRNRNRSHSGSHRNDHTTGLAGARSIGLPFGNAHLGSSLVTRRVCASCSWLRLFSVAWLQCRCLLGPHGCTTQGWPCTVPGFPNVTMRWLISRIFCNIFIARYYGEMSGISLAHAIARYIARYRAISKIVILWLYRR